MYHNTSIRELVVLYKQWADQRYRNAIGEPTRTALNNGYAIKPLAVLYPSHTLDTLDNAEVLAVQQRMVEERLARTTINDRMSRCRTFVRWAIKNQHASSSAIEPWNAVGPLLYGRSGAAETSPIVSADQDDVQATLKHLSDTLQRMIKLHLITGMRSTELCSMAWEQIDRSKSEWVYSPVLHKTQHHGHKRYIPIPKDARELLGTPKRRGLVFPNTRGKRYTRDTYRQEIVRAAKRAGCNRWTPLQIRHSAATRWFDEAGYDVASVLLGHRDRRSTSRYIDQGLEDVLRASKKVTCSLTRT